MLKSDRQDFYDYLYRDKPLCRGKRLYKLIEEIGSGGWETGVKAVGGFSEDPLICKRFGARGNEGRDGPPAVYYARENYYVQQHPTLQPIVYTKEWMEEHPDVVTVCQTLPGVKRKFEEEVSSAICYPKEKEWVALEEKVRPMDTPFTKDSEYHAQGSINIYLTGRELERLDIGEFGQFGHFEHFDDVCKGMNEAKEKLEKFIPADLPVEYVKLYYCDSDSDLTNADSQGWRESSCLLHSYLKPRGKSFKEGYEYLPSRPVW